MSTGEGRMNRVAGCLALVLIGGVLAHAGRAASRESMGRDVEDADDRRAWREFVAVNWPADARERRADRAASLGADAPSTWETWQNVKDIFLLGGKDPGPWLARAPALSTTNAAARFDTGSFAAAVPAKHVVAGVMVPFDPIETATHVNETRLNRAAFEYVRANDLYNIDGQVA
ncbi:MAG TPA: hypothetical protein VHB68_13050, partial [Steroidobacteraceae bacterium]|nr:hypothetical protein [Steroidobacteraceae bacterium]